jgi:hypothetical protein
MYAIYAYIFITCYEVTKTEEEKTTTGSHQVKNRQFDIV